MLTHANLMAATAGLNEQVELPDGGRVISWLPSAHIAERGAHHYLPIVYGMTVTSCPNPREIIAVLPEVRPNWFFAVPRIWEKLKAGLEAMIAALPDEQRKPTEAAIAAAIEVVRLEQRGEPVPDELAATVAAGRRADLQPHAPPARPRRGGGDQRRRRADAGARCSSSSTRSGSSCRRSGGCRRPAAPARSTRAARMKLGTVGIAAPRRRAAAGRRRRAADPLRRRHERLPQHARARRPRRSTPTAGCTPATSARSTRTAT